MHLILIVFVVSTAVSGNGKMVQAACSSKIENGLFEDLLNMMLKIKGQGNDNQGIGYKKVPAFTASLTHSKTLGSGEIVKFDKVWTNVMNGYDSTTGVFTAPRAGLYQFSCTLMTPTGKTVRVHLWKNNISTVALYPGSGNGHNQSSINAVLELKKNDRVYMKEMYGERSIYSESRSNFSMFSGYLIA